MLTRGKNNWSNWCVHTLEEAFRMYSFLKIKEFTVVDNNTTYALFDGKWRKVENA